ncbi:hypothetical protein HG537_0E00530 [Torulaspora globosa]|uniref:Chromatin modification-related protein n=1 Tax=Torulaspora globosa TaxID=48254 RepID=A0A7H9HTL9_9SACH|nr:hypothetical protein HG537_0E00530 [Torulaspora sp. CBS 2947]
MDPSSVLEQTTQDVSNLQAEFRHLLEEIRLEDTELYELRRKASQKDAQLHKFIRQHGSLTEHPNEKELSRGIREDLERCKDLQVKKCVLANTALFLVAKHLEKLEKSIVVLEEDGLLAALENEADSGSEYSRESSVMSTGERRRKAASAGSAESGVRRRRQPRGSPAVERRVVPKSEEQSDATPLESNFDLQDYNDDLFAGINNNEEEDKTLYCFCQSVSYGEMVACDGAHCKYEWFHYPCVNLKEPPKGAWFCPDCRQEMAKGRLKKRRL